MVCTSSSGFLPMETTLDSRSHVPLVSESLMGQGGIMSLDTTPAPLLGPLSLSWLQGSTGVRLVRKDVTAMNMHPHQPGRVFNFRFWGL